MSRFPEEHSERDDIWFCSSNVWWLMPGREDKWRDFWTFFTGSSSSPWLVDGFKVVLWQVITAGSSHYGGTQTLQIFSCFSCMGCCGSPLVISVSPFIVWKNVAATESMFLSLKLKTYKKYHLPTHYWRGLSIAASYLGPDWAQLWLILPIIRHLILYETIIVLDYFCIPESVLQNPQKLISKIALFCLYSASLALNQDFYRTPTNEPPLFHFYFTQWTVSRLLHPVWLPAAHWHTGIWFLKAWGWQHTFPELFSFLLNHS